MCEIFQLRKTVSRLTFLNTLKYSMTTVSLQKSCMKIFFKFMEDIKFPVARRPCYCYNKELNHNNQWHWHLRFSWNNLKETPRNRTAGDILKDKQCRCWICAMSFCLLFYTHLANIGLSLLLGRGKVLFPIV